MARILLVEDSDLIASYEQQVLEAAGYEVVVARAAEPAIELALGEPGFDLILMDIRLGKGMDGVQAAKIILQAKPQPLIFLSGHSEPELVELTAGVPSFGYVVKNSNTAVLKAQIEMTLRVAKAEQQVKQLLAERELILRETHHRVKNNFNTVVTLLEIQADKLHGQCGEDELRVVAGRVQSMAVLYQRLYMNGQYQAVGAREYLGALIEDVLGNFPGRSAVKVFVAVQDVILPVGKVQPLAIIVNEVLTNVMKYAFAGREGGRLSIQLDQQAGRARLVIEDDGAGLPPDFDARKSNGFGTTLVGLLAGQLGGDCRFSSPAGMRFELDFPLD